jgi:hypothetical protein
VWFKKHSTSKSKALSSNHSMAKIKTKGGQSLLLQIIKQDSRKINSCFLVKNRFLAKLRLEFKPGGAI